MITLRVASVVDAPLSAVARALSDGATWRRAARAVGGRATAADGLLEDGDPLTFTGAARFDRGHRAPSRWTYGTSEDGDPLLTSVVRPDSRVRIRTTPTGAGVLTRIDFALTASPMVASMQRRAVLRFGRTLLGIVTLIARETPIVVAGALIVERDGVPLLLAARRGGDGPEAGRWELPGGKVQLGESEPVALHRELVEELGIDVEVGRRCGDDVELPNRMVLRAFRVSTPDEPVAGEHSELRWLPADRLDELDWLPADRALLPAVSAELARITA